MKPKTKLILFLLQLAGSLFINAQNTFNGIKTGDIAPKFSAKDITEKPIVIDSLLKKGKLVLVFYRGYWCPYCNRHLSNLQDSLDLIHQKGATVIAICPQLPENATKTAEKTKAEFQLIYDEGYKIMNAYGVAFELEKQTLVKYKLAGINLEKTNGNSANTLPVPATFIINKDGKIDAMDFNENYKQRMPVKQILSYL